MLAAGACLASGAGFAVGASQPCERWPAWRHFKEAHLSADGRIIDQGTPARVSVSEGQAYALLFALIARDRSAFERILAWTSDNLAGGDLAQSLPAWQWGRREDGSWGVLDRNAAADADLWLAYALLEAARIWHTPAWRALGSALAARILREEVVELPGVGPVLLPAPQGFDNAGGWRLNPSYWPLQVLRGLGTATGEAAWGRLAASARRLILWSAPQGLAPDWVLYPRPGSDAARAPADTRGAYAAIRVYLWAGMLAPADPDRSALLRALRPMAARVAARAYPPEWQDAASGASGGEGPAGFSAALVPLLMATGFADAAAAQRRRALRGAAGEEGAPYYGDALRLFGLGWHDHRYRFARDGRLLLAAEGECAAAR